MLYITYYYFILILCSFIFPVSPRCSMCFLFAILLLQLKGSESRIGRWPCQSHAPCSLSLSLPLPSSPIFWKWIPSHWYNMSEHSKWAEIAWGHCRNEQRCLRKQIAPNGPCLWLLRTKPLLAEEVSQWVLCCNETNIFSALHMWDQGESSTMFYLFKCTTSGT